MSLKYLKEGDGAVLDIVGSLKLFPDRVHSLFITPKPRVE